MSLDLKYLWAKKSDASGIFKWLPLLEHLEDTAAMMKLLWHHWLCEGQKDVVLQNLNTVEEEEALKLIDFLAYTHDIGKATPVFQAKSSYFSSEDLDHILIENLENAGYTDLFGATIEPKHSHHSIAGEAILTSFGVDENLASIVGAHHGTPSQSELDVKKDYFTYKNNYYQDENNNRETHKHWKKVHEALFNWALKKSGYASIDELPTINQASEVILSGLLIMADWIASNESYFPLLDLSQTEVEDRETRVENGFKNWYKTLRWDAESPEDVETIYKSRFDFDDVRDMQGKLFSIIDSIQEPGIVILEAPMGGGKTEAALIAAEQLAYKTGRSGIYFGLPTQATSNGIFPRIKDWLENIPNQFFQNHAIRLVHGKAGLNPDFANLPKASGIYDQGGSTVVNEWFSGRKTSALDDFVVGTVDQFLMVALKQKHLALRHLGFSKKVIIIDEVHAYDTYMGQYLYQAVSWMAAYGVPVIILSATLPIERRIELIEAYMAFSKHGLKRKDYTDTLNTEAYPLISYNDGDKVKVFSDFEREDDKSVKIIKIHDEELLSYIKELTENGGIVGIVLNSVKRAQDFYKNLRSIYGEDVTLIHSRFIATDRIEIENKIMAEIGKNVARPHFKIIIGTQVLEQSLDIDFDVLITDLAPMDLVIQRLGRLHRHNHARPEKLIEPKCFLLGCSDSLEFEKTSTAIYGDYLLIRTQAFIKDEIKLPSDISSLVQAVYSDKGISLDEENIKKYEKQN